MLSSFALRGWETASLIAFAYSALTAAVLRPGVESAVRLRAVGASMAGIAVDDRLDPCPSQRGPSWLAAAAGAAVPVLLDDGAAVCRADEADRRCVRTASTERSTFATGVHGRRSGSSKSWKFSYAGVYGLIPIALVLHLLLASRPDADRFWTVILVTDFVCFGFLPWIQTRPPRALEAGEPWPSSLRSFNLRVLGAASIRVNTFPSGHAAEGLAAALLVASVSPVVFVSILVAGAAVAAGAVLGRYHYAVDAFAGWLVALAVWLLLG